MPENWQVALIWGAGLSAVLFVGSILAGWILILRMPVDYLTADDATRRQSHGRHMAWHLVVVVLRNLLGLVLVIAGIVMLITPGQGVLCILLGLTLIDFPGKHNLLVRLLGKPSILKTLNGVRGRAGRPPLETPDHQ